VDDEHPRVRRVLGDDVAAKIVPCSAAVHAPRLCLIGTTSLSMVLGRPTTVSSCRSLQVGREVGGGRVRVVAADRVQDVDAVAGQLLGGDLERVLPLRDEPALDGVLDVRELDPAVAERAAAEAVQQVRLGPDVGGDRRGAAAEQPA
jgi:hypothetical protein